MAFGSLSIPGLVPKINRFPEQPKALAAAATGREGRTEDRFTSLPEPIHVVRGGKWGMTVEVFTGLRITQDHPSDSFLMFNPIP